MQSVNTRLEAKIVVHALCSIHHRVSNNQGGRVAKRTDDSSVFQRLMLPPKTLVGMKQQTSVRSNAFYNSSYVASK